MKTISRFLYFNLYLLHKADSYGPSRFQDFAVEAVSFWWSSFEVQSPGCRAKGTLRFRFLDSEVLILYASLAILSHALNATPMQVHRVNPMEVGIKPPSPSLAKYRSPSPTKAVSRFYRVKYFEVGRSFPRLSSKSNGKKNWLSSDHMRLLCN